MFALQARRPFRYALRVCAVALGAVTVTVVLQFAVAQAASPSASRAIAASTIFHACYVPSSGTVYRIKAPGLREDCTSTSHVQFSWTDGADAAGAIKSGDAASGDLSGTYPGPTVAKLRGVAVDPTAPTNGQVLAYDGAAWKPATPSAGGGVSGWEVVSASNQTLESVVTHFEAVSAECPVGKVPVGGGYDVHPQNLGLMINSKPSGLNGWTLTLSHNTGFVLFPNTATVYAVCVTKAN